MILGTYKSSLNETRQPTEANIAVLREMAPIPVAEPYLCMSLGIGGLSVHMIPKH
jgi:hypothetical protein